MKRIIKITLILVALCLSLIGVAFSYYIFLLSPVSKDKTLKEVTINNNTTVNQIAELLKDKDVIRNVMAFKIYTKLHNYTSLKSGIYQLSENMSTQKIVKSLYEGKASPIGEISILFKEGRNMRYIAKTIAANTNNKEVDIYNILKDQTYINSLISQYWFLTDEIKNTAIYYPLEGYLAPNTYRFNNKNVSVKEIFKRMLDQTKKLLEPYKDKYKDYTIHQYITIASIIEQEGKTLEDRKNIAGVLYNRLKAGDSLGSDVTTYYAIKVDNYVRDLTYSEINTYNPYNTRGPQMNGKLPIGPIGNCGQTALEATFEPNHNNYYYFVADINGKVYFMKTIQEHSSKIRELKEKGLWYTF